MKFSKILSVAACAAAAVALTAAAADAKPRKKRHAARGDVIVVHPRAFTDSGNVVPVGSRNFYVQQSTYFMQQPYEKYSPGLLWRPESAFRYTNGLEF